MAKPIIQLFNSFEKFDELVISKNQTLNLYYEFDETNFFEYFHRKILVYYGKYYFRNFSESDSFNSEIFADALAEIIPPYFEFQINKSKPNYKSVDPIIYNSEKQTSKNDLTDDPTFFNKSQKSKPNLNNQLINFGLRRDFLIEIIDSIEDHFIENIPNSFKDIDPVVLTTDNIKDLSFFDTELLTDTLNLIKILLGSKVEEVFNGTLYTSQIGYDTSGEILLLTDNGNLIFKSHNDRKTFSIKRLDGEYIPIDPSDITDKKYVDSKFDSYSIFKSLGETNNIANLTESYKNFEMIKVKFVSNLGLKYNDEIFTIDLENQEIFEITSKIFKFETDTIIVAEDENLTILSIFGLFRKV